MTCSKKDSAKENKNILFTNKSVKPYMQYLQMTGGEFFNMYVCLGTSVIAKKRTAEENQMEKEEMETFFPGFEHEPSYRYLHDIFFFKC